MNRRRSSTAAVVALAAAIFAGCDDVPTGPSMAEVAGSYQATVFQIHQGLDTIDILADSGRIDIVLDADGTTTGELFVPDDTGGGGDFLADLAGTWRIRGSLITFDHSANTFIRDMPFFYDEDDGVIEGQQDFGGPLIIVVLERR